jgi:hypothetical protein
MMRMVCGVFKWWQDDIGAIREWTYLILHYPPGGVLYLLISGYIYLY